MIEDSRKKYWSEIRSQFTESYEVPPLPIVDKKEWEDFYVPILIQLGAIPKNKLVVGKRYYGSCRNGANCNNSKNYCVWSDVFYN